MRKEREGGITRKEFLKKAIAGTFAYFACKTFTDVLPGVANAIDEITRDKLEPSQKKFPEIKDPETIENSITKPQEVEINRKKIASAFTPSVQYWNDSIQRWALVSGLDPDLLATVIQIESCGDPDAISRSGAMGLFQVMPFNFPKEAQKDPQRMLNTELNASIATQILKKLLDKTKKDVLLALAAYNGGNVVLNNPNNPEKWPEETRRYYKWANIYLEVKKDPSNSPTLKEWLSFGGASLCEKAEERLGISKN